MDGASPVVNQQSSAESKIHLVAPRRFRLNVALPIPFDGQSRLEADYFTSSTRWAARETSRTACYTWAAFFGRDAAAVVWGQGPADKLAAGVRAAINQTGPSRSVK